MTANKSENAIFNLNRLIKGNTINGLDIHEETKFDVVILELLANDSLDFTLSKLSRLDISIDEEKQDFVFISEKMTGRTLILTFFPIDESSDINSTVLVIKTEREESLLKDLGNDFLGDISTLLDVSRFYLPEHYVGVKALKHRLWLLEN